MTVFIIINFSVKENNFVVYLSLARTTYNINKSTQGGSILIVSTWAFHALIFRFFFINTSLSNGLIAWGCYSV